VTSTNTNPSVDWVSRTGTGLLGWWLPLGAIIAGLLTPAPVRAAIWIGALAWIGVPCI